MPTINAAAFNTAALRPKYRTALLTSLLWPALSLPLLAAAAPLTESLQAGMQYQATIDYHQSATIERVEVKAAQGKTLTPLALEQLKSKYQALAQDAFEGINGAYHMSLKGTPALQQKTLVLPMHGKFSTPSYDADFKMTMSPIPQGYYIFDLSPGLSLMWGGKGEPPLRLISQELHDHLIDVFTSANAPFGYEAKPKQVLDDGLHPLNLGLSADTQGELHATATLTWPTPHNFQYLSVALPGQQLTLLGINAQVRSAQMNIAGQPLLSKAGNWPGAVKTQSLIRFEMPYPNKDNVDVQMTVRIQTATQQTWTVTP